MPCLFKEANNVLCEPLEGHEPERFRYKLETILSRYHQQDHISTPEPCDPNDLKVRADEHNVGDR